MLIETIEQRNCVVVRLSGRIDGSAALMLGCSLRHITDLGRYKIVVNMGRLTTEDIPVMPYIRATILRDLIKDWANYCRWNYSDLRLAEVPSAIDSFLDLTGIKPQLAIYATEAEAVGSF